jgi:hypothetical protein
MEKLTRYQFIAINSDKNLEIFNVYAHELPDAIKLAEERANRLKIKLAEMEATGSYCILIDGKLR